jgi:hypothetical protein
VALSTGRLVNLATGQETSFFTNGAGRAAFTQLAPGRYRAEVLDVGSLEITIEADAPAIVNLGSLVLERRR